MILLLGAGFVFFLLPRWVERSAGTPATAAPPAVPAEPAPAPAEPQKDLERLAGMANLNGVAVRIEPAAEPVAPL